MGAYDSSHAGKGLQRWALVRSTLLPGFLPAFPRRATRRGDICVASDERRTSILKYALQVTSRPKRS